MILKYLLILLGLFEIISNLIHFSRKTVNAIGESAKKQHQELPLNLPNIHFFYKAIIMLVFGFLFLISGSLSFFNMPYSSLAARIVTVCFGLYGIIQAIIYRKEIKVWPAMVVYNIPLLICIFIK